MIEASVIPDAGKYQVSRADVCVSGTGKHTGQEDEESNRKNNAPRQHPRVVVPISTGAKRKVRHHPLRATTARLCQCQEKD